MPVYEYHCPANGTTAQVFHGMNDRLSTWAELHAAAGLPAGDTPDDAPVERLLFASGVNTPQGDSSLKNLGFTKLVKRDTGVYENVTATSKEKRYMQSGDASSMPDFKSKITD